MNAVIGYTGFIGGIIKEEVIGDYFNSSNINEILNRSYDIVYCSGVSSSKWKANKNPYEDSEKINELLQVIRNVKCDKFVLISTISIYDDEPYGINRKRLEDNLLNIFNNKLIIVRLPAVYGKGLRKNLLFDMLNNKTMSKINIRDKYQWYNVNNIKLDIDRVIESGERVVEFFPEPITNKTLLSFFKNEFEIIDDINKSYIQNIIPKNGYLYSSDKVIKDLKKFINDYC